MNSRWKWLLGALTGLVAVFVAAKRRRLTGEWHDPHHLRRLEHRQPERWPGDHVANGLLEFALNFTRA